MAHSWNSLLTPLADRRQHGDDHDRDRQNDEQQRDRALHEGHETALGKRERLAQLLLHQTTEHEPEQHRRGLQSELDEHVTHEAEERGEVHVRRVVVDRVDADAAEEQDRGEHEAIGHLQEAHPQPDQRQVDDDQQQIADPHRGDHAPEEVGVLEHHLRPWNDAVDGHRAHHQRHDGVRRNAQREQRNERGLSARVVRRSRDLRRLRPRRCRTATGPSPVSSPAYRRRTVRERRRCPAGCRAPIRCPSRARPAWPSGGGPPRTAAAARCGVARPRGTPGSRGCAGSRRCRKHPSPAPRNRCRRRVRRTRASSAPRRSRDRCRRWKAAGPGRP